MEQNIYKEKLNILIIESKLNTKEKKLWNCFLKISLPDEDEAVFEAASENQENLYLLTKHLYNKILNMKEEQKIAFEKLSDGDNLGYAN
jgi:hypothetical protein